MYPINSNMKLPQTPLQEVAAPHTPRLDLETADMTIQACVCVMSVLECVYDYVCMFCCSRKVNKVVYRNGILQCLAQSDVTANCISSSSSSSSSSSIHHHHHHYHFPGWLFSLRAPARGSHSIIMMQTLFFSRQPKFPTRHSIRDGPPRNTDIAYTVGFVG